MSFQEQCDDSERRSSIPPALVDRSDPRILEAIKTPGRLHTAVGRAAILHDEKALHDLKLRRGVLLVHDDPNMLAMLRDTLVGAGIHVTAVGTTTEANSQLARRNQPHPSVVVLDYLLGLTTAMDVLKDLPREFRAHVVTAHPDTKRIAATVRPWATFSSTPFDVETLAQFVHKVIELLDSVTPVT